MKLSSVSLSSVSLSPVSSVSLSSVSSVSLCIAQYQFSSIIYHFEKFNLKSNMYNLLQNENAIQIPTAWGTWQGLLATALI
jgi:hypothetical protein